MNPTQQKKKILIISVSAGAGHVRAAEALAKEATGRQYEDIEVMHIDMMNYVSRPMRKAIVETYDTLVRTVPSLWGYIYEKTNDDKRVQTAGKMVKKVNQFNCRKFYKFLNTYNPDAIICTHSFPAQAIDQSLEIHHREIPVSMVITDYGIHSYWLLQKSEFYFVATKKMKWEIEQRGVDPDRVKITGIPVDPVFYTDVSRAVLQKTHAISSGEKVILVLSGGQGFMASDEVVSLLLSHTFRIPVRIIAISGKNKKLQATLENIADSTTTDVSVDVIGWTDEIDAYMRLADVVVTKPGGSTTSECIVLEKPIVAMNPIPGQEEHNAEYIAQQGYGRIARTSSDLLYYVSAYLEKNIVLQKQKKEPTAAAQILDTVVQSL